MNISRLHFIIIIFRVDAEKPIKKARIMDRTDSIILKLLMGNARMSFQELGEKIGMSRVAAKKHVQKLEKAGRKKSPVLLSMKSIGLVDAMVSILMLEIALIDTFGDISGEWARTMMAVSGSCVWLIAMAIGVFGIRWYMRRKL